MPKLLCVWVEKKESYSLSAVPYNTPGYNTDLDIKREGSDSVVECLTRDRGAAGWSLTGVTV